MKIKNVRQEISISYFYNYLLVSVVSQSTRPLIGAFWQGSSESCFVAASSYQKQNKKYREKKKVAIKLLNRF